MTSVRTVLVVGGGTAGATLAALLARAGVSVDIAERNPRFTAQGSGITLRGAALRVLAQVGVLDELRRHGHEFGAFALRSVDGRLLAEQPSPITMGVDRSWLARLLAGAAIDAGAKVRLGGSVASLTQDDDGVDVVFSDGDAGRYDLLVGADGVRSTTRAMLGIDAEPHPVNMGIWQFRTHRPVAVTDPEFCCDGPCYFASFIPTGPDTVDAYLVEPAHNRFADTRRQRVARIRELAGPYHGAWNAIRDDLTDTDVITYTWFEHLLIRGPWNRGRGVVIGDAAHACPPTLALGAAMALEDAAVLAELLLTRDRVDQDLFDAFLARRLSRVRTVVDGSMQLVTWLHDDRRAGMPRLMGHIDGLLGRPA